MKPRIDVIGVRRLVRHRRHDVVLHLGQLAQAVVLLDERLRDLLLNGEEPLAVSRQFLPLGHVDGDHDVAAGGRGRRVLEAAVRVAGRGRVDPVATPRPRPTARRAPCRASAAGAPAPHDAAALLAVLACGRPGHLGCGLGVDRFQRRPHGVDGLAPLVDLCRVDEVGDGADADDLRRPVAEHLLRPGREERDGAGGVDAHDGAPRGGPEQGLEAVAGIVRLAGVPAGDPRLLGQVAQEGPVPRDHGVDGRRHQGGDGGHHGHLAPLDRRVLG